MKKYILLFSLFVITLSSCQKSDVTAQQAAVDDAKIQAYMKANNLTLTKDPSGFYYKIITPGAAAHPIATSNVQVSYTNTYLNGIQFDHVNVVTYQLSTTIPALQLGLLKIGTGGRIYLIAPSALAYGNTSQYTVPANSILIYTIDLIGYN
ncbi:FKBP-type peptidyl-prolyl cis-trans isomerase [Mucilaginibacter sp.]|uniref:FKBP-type peptidyl-prolyl cis-trans isomerase n=1 Tax=Mucilaginibacter sp. TaxID=1882438 RepID=UPI0026357293|nr:FKBP-type peptidyl-prolyl cis-trans isomerase [Mucilaginibacter sp.]MDB5029973.1 peptidylprolyl isomerase [Mucilaginibacter sp.]